MVHVQWKHIFDCRCQEQTTKAMTCMCEWKLLAGTGWNRMLDLVDFWSESANNSCLMTRDGTRLQIEELQTLKALISKSDFILSWAQTNLFWVGPRQIGFSTPATQTLVQVVPPPFYPCKQTPNFSLRKWHRQSRVFSNTGKRPCPYS